MTTRPRVRRRHVLRCAAMLICCMGAGLLLDVQPLAAQSVAGRVTHASGGVPLAGVYVSLTNEAGSFVAGGLTDVEGRYVLRAPAPGRYDLQAELIGYSPESARALLLAANTTERRDLSMTVRAIDLQAITVEAENRCRSGPPAAPATQELWEAARTALRVTQWTHQMGALRFALVQTRRELDHRTMNVKAETIRTRSGHFAGSPYIARPAEELSRDGYVTRAEDGRLDYWAPDADVLLSESFLADHCFRVTRPDASEPGFVGLAFEPVAGRDVPEIDGVLWIDAATSELRRLDFRYVNLPFRGRKQWDQVGGRVEFARLDNGMWIVSRWRIRMPVVVVRNRIEGASSVREFELSELNELSAEVTLLSDAGAPGVGVAPALPGGDAVADVSAEASAPARKRAADAAVPDRPASSSRETVLEARPGRHGVFGVVTSESGAAPGVAVTLSDSTGTRVATALTDENGNFSMQRLPGAGSYELSAEHIGYDPTRHRVTVGPREAVRVAVRLATNALPLGEIRVTARRQDFLADAGFYDRMRRGMGWFVDAEEVDRRKPWRVTDLLRSASGVRVVPTGTFESDIRIIDAQRLHGDCPPTIYIDGFLARSAPRAEPALTELVDGSNVAALEVLRRPSEIPPRYNGSNAACGVVLVWLKR